MPGLQRAYPWDELVESDDRVRALRVAQQRAEAATSRARHTPQTVEGVEG